MAADEDDAIYGMDPKRPGQRGAGRNDEEFADEIPFARAADADEFADDDRPTRSLRKKKKRKPLPAMLISMAVVALLLGGLLSLSGCLMFAGTLGSARRAPSMAHVLGGVSISVLTFLVGVANIGGGVALFLRRAFGRQLLIGAAVAMQFISIFALVGQIIKALDAMEDRFWSFKVFIPAMICVVVNLFVFGVLAFFFKSQENKAVNDVLR